MTTDLEQLLRDALEARAVQVTPAQLDLQREQELRRALAGTQRPAHRWRRPVLTAATGLAAAAVIAATVVTVNRGGPPPPAVGSQSTDRQVVTSSVMVSTTMADSSTTSTPPAMRTTARQRRVEPVPTQSHRIQPTATPTPTTDLSSTAEALTSSTTEETSSTDASATTQSAPAAATVWSQRSVDGSTLSLSYGAKGTAHPNSGGLTPTYTRVDYGDGSQDGTSERGGCDATAPAQPVSWRFGPLQHAYAQPGRYVVTVTVGYCNDDGATTTTTADLVTIG